MKKISKLWVFAILVAFISLILMVPCFTSHSSLVKASVNMNLVTGVHQPGSSRITLKCKTVTLKAFQGWQVCALWPCLITCLVSQTVGMCKYSRSLFMVCGLSTYWRQKELTGSVFSSRSNTSIITITQTLSCILFSFFLGVSVSTSDEVL